MSNMTQTRLVELKNRLELLKREADSAVSNVRCVVKRGISVLSFQESIQEVEHFLRSYPVAGTEIDHLINNLVKLNCELEITLARKSDFCNVFSSCENNDSVFYDCDVLERKPLCVACAKDKKTVSTNTDNVTVDNPSEFDKESITKLYDIEDDSILEMKYLQGNDPSQFWLGYYSDSELLSHLAEIKRKLQLGELHRIATTPVVGQCIIGCVSSVFRGCIISAMSRNFVAVDLDTGEFKFLNLHDIWEIGDCLSCFPPQAILCKLWSVESLAGWNKYLGTLFSNCLRKCNLVITVKGIILDLVPIFIVDVDAHDSISLDANMSTSLDVNMSEWINSFVCPAIERMRLFELSDSTEEAIFHDLDPYVIYRGDDGSDCCTSEQSVDGLQDVKINSQVVELRASVPRTDEINIDSNCTVDDIDETRVRDSSVLIFNDSCTGNEMTPLDYLSDDNNVAEKPEIVNQVNEVYSAEDNVKRAFEEQCDTLECEVLSKSCGQNLKSSVVKCFLEKDETLGMSFFRGSNPWSFFLSYVPVYEIDELKKKIAQRAESGLLIPFPNVPEIDDFAIGKCDSEYCRVRVCDVPEENIVEDIVVTDIDSGEIKLVSVSDLWVLDEVFSLLPARAISCTLWNIPRNHFYWCLDLENLFRNVMSRGPCCVNVKDVEYVSGNWTHFVQIQIFTDNVFDVSEWIMNFIFPNLKNIKQCCISGSNIDDAISKLDPNRVFNKKQNDNSTTQEFVNNQTNSKVAEKPLVLKSPPSECKTVLLKSSETLPKVKNFLANALKLQDALNFKRRSYMLEPRKKYYVFMSSILSPNEFYIHVISEENSFIDKMHQELTHYCSVGKMYFKNKAEAKQLIPQCCAVYFKDRWLRGTIIDWFDASSDDVSVFLVDYGVYTTVQFHFIQPLRSDFYEYPVFAERCALAFISPPDNNGTWPEKSVKAFSDLLDYDTVYEIYIVNRLELETFCVFLFCVENEKIWCINDYLVEEGCAVSEMGGSTPTETENSHVIYYPIIDSGIDETISDSDSDDDCHQPQSVEIIPYFDNNTAGLPDVGEELSVVLTEVVNMSLFYAVPAKIQYEGRLQSTHEVLMKMNKKITSTVQSGQLKLSKQLREGTIAVARYSKDKNWYRVRVLASPADNGYVEVFFVDYGNVDKVHKFYIREIKKDFCEVPFQAMRCFVDSINMARLREKNAQEIAQTLLTSLVDKFEVVIEVTRVVNEDIEVKVLYEGRDIGEEMINLYYTQCE